MGAADAALAGLRPVTASYEAHKEKQAVVPTRLASRPRLKGDIRMRTLHVVVGLSMLMVPVAARAQDAPAGLDSTVARLGRDFLRDQHAVGLSIGVYANGDRHFYNFGTTVKGEAHPPTERTVYEIGSITKTFVGLVLAHAALEGRVNLRDDVRKYLKGSYPNLEYNGEPVRIVDLATTTSSLPDWLPAVPPEARTLPPDSAQRVKIDFYRGLGEQDFLNALHTVKLDTIPGTRQQHSNAGAQLLAYILEDVYGAPMDELIRRYVTHPAGMNHTYFLRPDEMANVARGYTASGKDAGYEYVMPYFRYAGGLGSTTGDLVQYIEMLLDRSNPAARLCLTKTADVSASSARVVPMSVNETPSPAVYSVALDWLEYRPSASDFHIWSDGGTNGFNSYLVIYPLLHSGVVLLTNTSAEGVFRALPGLADKISQALGSK